MAIARYIFELVFGFLKPWREHREIADTRGELREKTHPQEACRETGRDICDTAAPRRSSVAEFVPGVCGILSPKLAVPHLLCACSMLGLKIEAEAETEAETETEIEANTETEREKETDMRGKTGR